MMYLRDVWQRVRDLYVSRHEPENLRPLAEIAWRTLLILVLGGVGGVMFFSVSVFWGVIGSLNATGAAASKPPLVLDRNALDATVRQIQARRQAFDAAKSAPRPVVEPLK